MPQIRPHIAKATLTTLALLCLGIWIVVSTSVVNAEPEDYDTNGNGILEKNEVLAVVIDYFRDRISKDDVLEVLILYFLSDATPVPTPTPIASPTSIPEPTPTPRSSQEDVTAPGLVEVTLDRSEVDVSEGPKAVTVRVRATDDISGISSVQLNFKSPSGGQQVQTFATAPTTGSFKDGVYVDTVELPQFSEAGTWRLKYAWIDDATWNQREYRPAVLTALGLGVSFEVVAPQTPTLPSTQEDVTTPELVEVTLYTSEVDVSEGPKAVTVTVRATDDISGISRVELSFKSPSGRQEVRTFATAPITGSLKDGVYVDTMPLPQFSEAGIWRLQNVWIHDVAWNLLEYRPDELATLGLGVSFEVVALQSDVTGPEVIGVTVSPTEVDVSKAAGTVDVEVKATDDLSDIRSVQVSFGSPTGGQSGNVQQLGFGSPTGDQSVGLVSLTLPKYSEAGTWRLKYLGIHDVLGNLREYRPAELMALGLTASFEVVATREDVAPPELVSVTLDRSEVDMTNGPANVTVTVRAIDDLSGIESVYVHFESPTGLRRSASYHSRENSNKDEYALRLTLSQYSETGTWLLKYLSIRDEVGNLRECRLTELAALGLATSFEVVN